MAVNLDGIRAAVQRRTTSDGQLRDTRLQHRYPIYGTAAEVVSLSPPRVEILSGPVVKVDALIGAVPAVGDVVLLLEVVSFKVAVTGVQVV